MAFTGQSPKFKRVRYTPQSSAPSNPTEGDLYYDDGTSTTEGLYVYKNATWERVGNQAVSFEYIPQSADPASPVEGEVFYADGTSRAEGLYVYKNGAWETVGNESLSYRYIPQSVDPLSPIEGQVYYADGTTREPGLYVYKSGAWEQVGSSVKTSEVNFIENAIPTFDLTGWSTYANTTPATKPDDFGGTVASGFTLTRNTSFALVNNTVDFLLTKPASNCQGNGFYYQFSQKVGLNTMMHLFSVIADLSELNDNDISIWIVGSNDNFVSDFSYISPNDPDVKVSTRILKQLQLNDKGAYRLCIHWNSTDTTAKTAQFNNFFYGPKETAVGAVLTDWVDFTPTGSWITNTTYTGKYKQVGDTAEIQYKLDLTGAPTATSLDLNMPSGLSIDTNKLLSDPSGSNIMSSFGIINDTGFSNYIAFGIYVGNSTSFRVSCALSSGTFDTQSSVNATTPIPWGSGDALTVTIRVPIAGWSSQARISEDFGTRDIVVKGSSNGNTSITASLTPIDFTELEDNSGAWNGTTFTSPETSEYVISGVVVADTASSYVIQGHLNGVGKTISADNSSRVRPFFDQVTIPAGQTYELKSDTNIGLTPTSNHHISITKLASPQTLLETDTVAARYTSNSGQLVGTSLTDLNFEDVVRDTHNAYDTSTGVYTVPISGWYSVSSTTFTTGVTLSTVQRYIILLLVDGTAVDRGNIAWGNGANVPWSSSVSTEIYLEKGQEVKVQGISAVATSLSTNSSENTFSIARIK